GAVRTRPGSLYRVLDRMMKRGLLHRLDRAPVDDGDDERRTYYGITASGRAELRNEAELLSAVA
ncbi:MAG: PadR family transcriptional regulator, partial [Thermoplasmata archaeon]|nr:PadR family transcriptional regulator [Thermoplasmata archaeon]NIS20496.1 PadR family transcriptional regulator [Thermoplasmata archaeon]NIT77872.1 PadR family transcriptional regulator [Thermoplasmata archaeon]NIU49585.1 PadR family transcriptional regulator [Thermoplasmata archaeon]NIV79258.1 PadR family transcriptional regulator [Thermoplasmata archaeon]